MIQHILTIQQNGLCPVFGSLLWFKGLVPSSYQNNEENDVRDENEEIPGSDCRSIVNRLPQDTFAMAAVIVLRFHVVKLWNFNKTG